jgi:hypothetical protein
MYPTRRSVVPTIPDVHPALVAQNAGVRLPLYGARSCNSTRTLTANALELREVTSRVPVSQ